MLCCDSVEWPAIGWRRGVATGGGDSSARGRGDELRGLQREAPSLKARAAGTAGTRVRGAAGGAAGERTSLARFCQMALKR